MPYFFLNPNKPHLKLMIPLIKSILILGLFSSPLNASGLPDTGQTLCDDGANNLVACTSANTGDTTAKYPGQDGRFGRDPAAITTNSPLIKQGAGHAGFDYTKICNSGEKAGTGNCPADPALGNGSNDWACTLDNVTGLIWEVKTNDNGLRDKDWTFTWYNTDASTNGGYQGTPDDATTDNCANTSRCDTKKYITDIQGLCGYSDWRLPSQRELITIRNLDNPDISIDTTYFPNTNKTGLGYWTSSYYGRNPNPDFPFARTVSFDIGKDSRSAMSFAQFVRLVRGNTF